MSGNSFTLHELSSPNPKAVFENASSGGAELNDLVALNSSGKTVAATDAASIRVEKQLHAGGEECSFLAPFL